MRLLYNYLFDNGFGASYAACSNAAATLLLPLFGQLLPVLLMVIFHQEGAHHIELGKYVNECSLCLWGMSSAEDKPPSSGEAAAPAFHVPHWPPGMEE
jgi:hypothetical protein